MILSLVWLALENKEYLTPKLRLFVQRLLTRQQNYKSQMSYCSKYLTVIFFKEMSPFLSPHYANLKKNMIQN